MMHKLKKLMIILKKMILKYLINKRTRKTKKKYEFEDVGEENHHLCFKNKK